MYDAITSHLQHTSLAVALTWHPTLAWNASMLIPALVLTGIIVASMLYWLFRARRWMILVALGILVTLMFPLHSFLPQATASFSQVSSTFSAGMHVNQFLSGLP
jgi:uncharacterized membrane protein YoaK (UPF0700 family)